ncbi:hypothetical protein [Staphylococcus nepalensis]|uniref:hypothetical protein n=1 Tax=Staphylococcus nepalensis TaxID=214473 RepID=UPI0032E8B0C8
MAYEYEESNKQIVFTVDNESSMGELNERIKELQEVYRKAKAWDNYIAEVIERVKITVNTDDDIEKETQEVIDYYMERADDER